ncbi:fumarylacetoacetate hydrolase family protein [Catalinimonas niigatensis]|uniref:fumarylacetoacetate hydrolase family protein n=1 Tax=Catalinimonas niigatensis TaxID=1397264 RepID=UPI002666061C|nr:fumarylacetoacetate hydrolase family protein [Catalinimonas niigatensis]WPP51706.1 fumarylacetoacetate hydrolase family protein [Catalinimonas niigatensis]
MKIYNTRSGIIIEQKGEYFLNKTQAWDQLVNQDNLYDRLVEQLSQFETIDESANYLDGILLPPLGTQEVWGSGVTYYRSRDARMEESKDAGGGDFYDRVYDAARPELFFKAPYYRVVGNRDHVRIRRDSKWDVPEPEMTLFITSSGKIQGYTVGNDMSSRSIEGENPLYLPQAKSYNGSTSIGPCLFVPEKSLAMDTVISIEILRNGAQVFAGDTSIDQMKRGFSELVEYLFRECDFPQGVYLMTGTGIIPSHDFTLQSGDEIRISVEPIGTLINFVAGNPVK